MISNNSEITHDSWIMNCYSLMEFHHLYLYLLLYLIKDHPFAEHCTDRIWFCICFYICLWQPIGVRPIFTIWLESNGKNNDGMHSPRADLVSMDMVKEIWTFFFNKNKNRTERQLMENATSQVCFTFHHLKSVSLRYFDIYLFAKNTMLRDLCKISSNDLCCRGEY